MENIKEFLIRTKQDRLLNIYQTDTQEIHNLMDKLYKCAFRFNLTGNQTIYLLDEALRSLDSLIDLDKFLNKFRKRKK